jgi:superoxide reductase
LLNNKNKKGEVMGIADSIKSAEWKTEKHAPVIEVPETVKAGEKFTLSASVGKEIAHPNTTEHFISWIQVYFLPDGEKNIIQLADNQFTAHGESAAGANQGPAFTEPGVSIDLKLSKSGTLKALSYCNIHGLWESEKSITVN